MENKKNKYRAKKRYQAIFWGLVLILAAVVLVLDGIGLELAPGFTPWRIIGGVLLFAWLVYEIIRLKFAEIFLPIAFLFIVFRDPLAELLHWDPNNLPKTWVVILAAVLLTAGFHVLFDRKATVTINGHEAENGGKIGKETLYADAANLSGFTIKDHLGAVELFITNRESYPGNGVITVCDNLGLVTLHLPNDWNVVTQCSDNLGTIAVPEHETFGDRTVTLDVHDNLGRLEVKFEET